MVNMKYVLLCFGNHFVDTFYEYNIGGLIFHHPYFKLLKHLHTAAVCYIVVNMKYVLLCFGPTLY